MTVKDWDTNCHVTSPSPLTLPLVLAAIAHLVVAALLPVLLVVLVVADEAVAVQRIKEFKVSFKNFQICHSFSVLRWRVLGDPFSGLVPWQVVPNPECKESLPLFRPSERPPTFLSYLLASM